MKISLQNKIAKYLFTLCICTSIGAGANAQAWQNVGEPGFSTGLVNYTRMAVSGAGTPYIAYQDGANDYKVTVMKYNGTDWVNVGNPGFSAGQADYVSLVIDVNGNPYVAYSDYGNGHKATLMKYNGSTWVTIGSAGFSGGEADYTSLALDGNGNPYVAYEDYSNGYKATLMEYDGNNWITVGNAGFSADEADYISLVINNNGTIYIAYQDYGNSYKATVMTYNGSSWTAVGNAGFSPGMATYISLVTNNNGMPYIAYNDWSNSYKATVMKYDNNAWVAVGSPGFSVNQADFISLAITDNGIPYIAYTDEVSLSSSKAIVMMYDGTNWEMTGNTGISDSIAIYTSLAIDGNGIPYVAYQDWDHNDKATVLKYADTTHSALVPSQSITANDLAISLFPNPAVNQLNVIYNAHNAANISLSVSNAIGQTVITKTLGKTQSGTITLPVEKLPSGIYILQFTSGTEVVRQKFVKQ